MGDWAFQYDTLNPLAVAAPALNAPNSPSNYRNTVACFGYDGFGNRTVAAFSPSSDCTRDTTATAAYDVNNHMTSVSQSAPIQSAGPITVDAAGNVITDPLNKYLYDGEGRLCAVQTILTSAATQYTYDASGGRVAKWKMNTWPSSGVCPLPSTSGATLTNEYLLDQGGDQVTELNGSGAWQHSNVWAGAHLDATYDAKGLHFHLADPLGTRRIQTNIDGQVEESCQSLPFGDNLNCTTTALTTADDATEHHFTGKERDTESGNDYFGARYYASTMGRWLSPDWSAKVEPVPYAKLGDPQTLNLYTYVGNNPLIHIDADGHCWPESLCKAVSNAWNNTKQALNQAGSYFYATGFKGTGDEIKVKVGPLKLEVGEKKGTEVTRHLNGEKEQKEVKQDAHLKAEIGPVSLGVERKQTGDGSKTEWSFSGEVNGVGGSGGQVGVNAEFCHGTCSSIEGGVEAGKALNDLIKNTPPPQPGSLDELMTIAPK